VIVTSSVLGCSKTTVTGAVVTVNANPAATVTPQGPVTICAGDSVLLKANYNSSYLYQWKKNNVNIAGATSHKYYAKTAGSYKVKVTNVNGCTQISSTVTVYVPCRVGSPGTYGTIDERDLFDVEAFPNPSRENFILKMNGKAGTEYAIRIFDITGREVQPEVFKISNEEFIISGLNPGVYFAAVSNNRSQQMIRISKME